PYLKSFAYRRALRILLTSEALEPLSVGPFPRVVCRRSLCATFEREPVIVRIFSANCLTVNSRGVPRFTGLVNASSVADGLRKPERSGAQLSCLTKQTTPLNKQSAPNNRQTRIALRV